MGPARLRHFAGRQLRHQLQDPWHLRLESSRHSSGKRSAIVRGSSVRDWLRELRFRGGRRELNRRNVAFTYVARSDGGPNDWLVSELVRKRSDAKSVGNNSSCSRAPLRLLRFFRDECPEGTDHGLRSDGSGLSGAGRPQQAREGPRLARNRRRAQVGSRRYGVDRLVSPDDLPLVPPLTTHDQQQAAVLYSELCLKTTSGDQLVNNAVTIALGGVGTKSLLEIMQEIVPPAVATDPVAFAAMVEGLLDANDKFALFGATVPPAPSGVNMGDVAQEATVAWMVRDVVNTLETSLV